MNIRNDTIVIRELQKTMFNLLFNNELNQQFVDIVFNKVDLQIAAIRYNCIINNSSGHK